MTRKATELANLLARELVKHTEPCSIDEALLEVSEITWKLLDDKLNAPLSALSCAELQEHLTRRTQESRYCVTINGN